MKLLFIIFIVLPTVAKADFVASAGLVGGRLESEETSSRNEPLLEVPTYIGFKGEAEFGHPYVTFFGSFDLGTGSGKTEYDYQNPSIPPDQAQVNGLDTRIYLSRLSLGIRLKLIKLKTYRMYAGGGLEYGIMNLLYDEDHFESRTGSSTGFQESERQNFRGGFAQFGMEFIIDNNSGFRIQVQKDYFRTDEFETLGNETLKFEPTTFSVSFMQYIDT